LGYFRNINLVNFRNFDSFTLEFSKSCNVLYGKNGSGKTNILEAISLFSKGRGFRKDKLSNIIKKNNNKFILKSNFQNNDIIYNLISETYESEKRLLKTLSINNDKSKESLDHIYKLTSFLFFLPETERLFISSPANRRNFIDRLIYTHDNSYSNLVSVYNKNLLERSELLSNDYADSKWLDRVEKNISTFGLQIYNLREKQIISLIHYLNIFLHDFNLSFKISADLNDKYYDKNLDEEHFAQNLKNNRKIDCVKGGSKIGPHKSDYIFYSNSDYLVSQLSTGQQKTLILLIFLAQCRYLIELFKIKPILLLDEACSHLDELNRKILLTLVESFDLQIFMTGTTKDLFSFLSTKSNFCNITS